MVRTCQNCNTQFQTKSSRQRFCSDPCRMRANYTKRTGQDAPVIALPVPVDASNPAGIVDAVERELLAAGRRQTPIGMLCMVLARQIEGGVDSASGLAQLSKELSARLGEALANVEVALNPVDELRVRREARNAR